MWLKTLFKKKPKNEPKNNLTMSDLKTAWDILQLASQDFDASKNKQNLNVAKDRVIGQINQKLKKEQ